MSDYLFTTGTCLKSELYDLIKNSMLAVGWVNASSNQATDYDVLTSTGEDNTKKLVFQLRPINAAGTAASNVTTSDSHVISFRLCGSYTPGADGVSGTFGRTVAQEAWKEMFLVPQAPTTLVPASTVVNYKLHVNKNRIIFALEYPSPFGLGSVVHYIGLPDITYCDEPNSRGLLYVSSCGAVNTANNVIVTDAVGELSSVTSSSTRAITCTLAPKNPNSSNKYMLSEIYYGNTTEGTRGKLTGIYALPNQNVNGGDTIKIGTKTFYVLVNQSYSTNGFPSLALAIQIS